MQVKFPRDTAKEGSSYGLLNEKLWLEMLQKRKLMRSTYDEKSTQLAYRLIMDRYFEAIKSVFQKLQIAENELSNY